MTFDELDDKAKERARDSWREGALQHEWWEYTYEDAIECAKALGFEIEQRNRPLTNGRTRVETEIWFRGFCSQGDGCCFSGTLALQDLEKAVERVKAHAPQDEELASLAILAESIWQQATAKMVELRLADEGEQIDMTSTFKIEGRDRYYTTKVHDVENEYEFLQDDLNNLVSSFADWIYSQLEAEYDYQTSDECVDENIKANEMEFDEEGAEA